MLLVDDGLLRSGRRDEMPETVVGSAARECDQVRCQPLWYFMVAARMCANSSMCAKMPTLFKEGVVCLPATQPGWAGHDASVATLASHAGMCRVETLRKCVYSSILYRFVLGC